ncbi:MAG: deoxyguanosinetriphosphate triphosphohydrolase family protein [Promethearchaeota archaeon]
MSFSSVSAHSKNPKWEICIKREDQLYRRTGIRSEFARDYTRILHCTAYRRLKHKTQVFSAPENDHICTRIEHVNHVASVSSTIAKELGLNLELISAIATGHDLGHAPFGHQGEEVLKDIITSKKINEPFWHEKNSLWFVDKIETLLDPHGKQRNLNLTYAVRDGIISHCGEVDENALFPREEELDLLSDIDEPGKFQPFTWEGCVVKIADKIAYLGRDIEDALRLKILTDANIEDLKTIVKEILNLEVDIHEVNNTVLMNDFIIDLCNSSSPESGIRFSAVYLDLINSIKRFNYNYIYHHPRLEYYKKYSYLIINSIFDVLSSFYSTLKELNQHKSYPLLINSFTDWLIKYSNVDLDLRKQRNYENKVIYDINNEEEYFRAIITYISGMTDNFAVKVFKELIAF